MNYVLGGWKLAVIWQSFNLVFEYVFWLAGSTAASQSEDMFENVHPMTASLLGYTSG